MVVSVVFWRQGFFICLRRNISSFQDAFHSLCLPKLHALCNSALAQFLQEWSKLAKKSRGFPTGCSVFTVCGAQPTMESLPRFLNLHMRLSTKYSVGIVGIKLPLEKWWWGVNVKKHLEHIRTYNTLGKWSYPAFYDRNPLSTCAHNTNNNFCCCCNF